MNTVDHGMLTRSKKRKIKHDLKFFDIPFAYKSMAEQIYFELLRLRDIGPKVIAQIIAEYAASVRETCSFCREYTIFVNEDSKEWLISHYVIHRNTKSEPQKIPTLAECIDDTKCDDDRKYWITNLHDHRRLDGEYQIICLKCAPGTYCTNCHIPAWDLHCGNCNESLCVDCVAFWKDYSVFVRGEEDESDASEMFTDCYFPVCAECAASYG